MNVVFGCCCKDSEELMSGDWTSTMLQPDGNLYLICKMFRDWRQFILRDETSDQKSKQKSGITADESIDDPRISSYEADFVSSNHQNPSKEDIPKLVIDHRNRKCSLGGRVSVIHRCSSMPSPLMPSRMNEVAARAKIKNQTIDCNDNTIIRTQSNEAF